MASNRRTQLKVAHSPGFAVQSDFGVPLDPSELTKVLTFREGGQSHIEPIFKTEDLKDCTTQYLIDLIILHRIARLTLDLEVDQETLAGLLGLALGITSGSTITMLGPTTFILPATTLIVGFDDEDDLGIILSDAVVESITLTARVDQKFQVRVVFVGRGNMPIATGYEFPECDLIDPIRFDQNALFTWGGTEYISETRAFEFTYNNNPPVNDFPFSVASVDIARALERGDAREYSVNWTVTGEEGFGPGAEAITVPPTHSDLTIRIGSLTEGIEIVAADAMIRPGSPFQGFDGEVSLAVLNLVLTPTRVPGDNSTPLTVNVL